MVLKNKVYKNPDDISDLPLTNTFKNDLLSKLDKNVYFKDGDNCKVGKMIGLVLTESGLSYYIDCKDYGYIINVSNSVDLCV